MAPSVRLEPLVPDHAEALFPGLQDPALYTFIPDAPPTSLEALRARYTRLATRGSPDGRQAWLNWALWSDPDAAYVGYVQATVEGDTALVAYVLFRPYWRRGYARAAVAEMMRWLEAEHAVTRFEARVDPRNVASRALLEALGFVCVAIHPEAECLRGEVVDECEYRREVCGGGVWCLG
jgi:ribosomal-protein-alanine N-acetyltransferase